MGNGAELEGLIGFVNMLAIHVRLDCGGGDGEAEGAEVGARTGADVTFAEAVRRIKEAMLEAQAHQDVPFEALVDHLHVERHADVNPSSKSCKTTFMLPLVSCLI